MPLRRRSFGGGGGAIDGLMASFGERGASRGCDAPWSDSSTEGRRIFFFRPNITPLFWYRPAVLPVRRHPSRDYGEKP